ncbi:hypothetical protein [Pseudorhodoplanes sinuspersici]|uniref:Uncharacterized protein n=1 Tax=Pseudorhodoplanes sinuspersici TaxID=1235591 RepID=A0A1W6ZLM2_9HYPH|nr:hypothetical protein [Pseudorhodoplanes sinuspersici]ARP98333.1 hypothetical protein CAK95_03945 [Pseudorhodoplanes sinuspersici]RKE65991.1 hypothetical protein DFP91_5565 [Pseudorhodoplanes sinuspersici]
MPLQNRVSPFGELFAAPVRGTFMGNRGGRIHDAAQKLGARRWASKQWICCVLDFKNRHRRVWGDSYTELFFLDEVTALAAGHRPCFECRRADANAFAQAWASAAGQKPSAPQMDDVLHAQRLGGRNKRMHRMRLGDLPDGAMIVRDGDAYAVKGDALLRWSPSGYGSNIPREPDETVDVLTPPAIVTVLSAGYQPRWHPSVNVRHIVKES